jgi:hypothetical protein
MFREIQVPTTGSREAELVTVVNDAKAHTNCIQRITSRCTILELTLTQSQRREGEVLSRENKERNITRVLTGFVGSKSGKVIQTRLISNLESRIRTARTIKTEAI